MTKAKKRSHCAGVDAKYEKPSPSQRARTFAAVDSDIDDGEVLTFTQVVVDDSIIASQSQFLTCTKREKENFESLDKIAQAKLVNDMTRYFIFKGMAKGSFLKSKAVDEVMPDYKKSKVAGAIFEQAKEKLKDLYGWDVQGPPQYMLESLPKKYQDRHYVVNFCPEDEDGSHAMRLHSRHDSGRNGLLVTMLMFVFNRGQIRNDTNRRNTFKWITEEHLYKLLNAIDMNIPDNLREAKDATLPELGSDVPSLVSTFIAQDYLITDKVKPQDDTSGVYYTWGPRAHLEVGRKQIMFFTAQVLDEQPDPTMLLEIENQDGNGGDDDAGEE